MRAARHHLRHSAAADIDGRGGGHGTRCDEGRGPLSKLPLGVVTPAFHGAVIQNSTGVAVSTAVVRRARGDLLHGPAAHVNRLQVVSHLAGTVSNAVPPTLGRSIVQHCAGLAAAGSDVHGSPASSQVDWRQVLTHLVWLAPDAGAATLAKLTRASSAPTLHGAIVQQSTNVVVPSHQLPCPTARPQVDRRQVHAHPW